MELILKEKALFIGFGKRKIKTRITWLTRRSLTPLPMDMVIENVNTTLRGWVNYFHYLNSSKASSRLKWHVEERVRTHLRKRHKVKGREKGYKRYSNKILYEKYGLYKVPTTAGWKKAHALS